MSHRAMSTPLMALLSTGPFRQYELTNADCQVSSIRAGSLPIRNGSRNLLMAVSTTRARCVKVAQPSPYSPGSLVSTFTTTSRMLAGAVRMTLTSVIFSGSSFFCGGVSARSVPIPVNAPAPIPAHVNTSRRFMVALPKARRGWPGLSLRSPGWRHYRGFEGSAPATHSLVKSKVNGNVRRVKQKGEPPSLSRRLALSKLLLLLDDPRMRRVAAPAGPAGEFRVASVDADQLAVLRADVNAPALDRRLEAQLGADLVGFRDLAFLRLDLQHVALQCRQEDLAAGGG